MAYHLELKQALEAAKLAGSIQLNKRHLLKKIEKKSDRSPVTEIDKQCEEQIKDHLHSHFPADGFLGEETGDHGIVDHEDGSLTHLMALDPISKIYLLTACLFHLKKIMSRLLV